MRAGGSEIEGEKEGNQSAHLVGDGALRPSPSPSPFLHRPVRARDPPSEAGYGLFAAAAAASASSMATSLPLLARLLASQRSEKRREEKRSPSRDAIAAASYRRGERSSLEPMCLITFIPN